MCVCVCERQRQRERERVCEGGWLTAGKPHTRFVLHTSTQTGLEAKKKGRQTWLLLLCLDWQVVCFDRLVTVLFETLTVGLFWLTGGRRFDIVDCFIWQVDCFVWRVDCFGWQVGYALTRWTMLWLTGGLCFEPRFCRGDVQLVPRRADAQCQWASHRLAVWTLRWRMHTPELVGLHGKHGQHEDTVHSKLCYDGVGGGGGGGLWYVCMEQGWGLLNIAQDEACMGFVAEELWESCGGCPGLLVPNKPGGFCGCEVTLKWKSLGYLIR